MVPWQVALTQNDLWGPEFGVRHSVKVGAEARGMETIPRYVGVTRDNPLSALVLLYVFPNCFAPGSSRERGLTLEGDEFLNTGLSTEVVEMNLNSRAPP